MPPPPGTGRIIWSGRVLRVRDAWYGTRRFGYDGAGRVLTQRSADGRVTRYSYLPGLVTQVADADGPDVVGLQLE